MEWLGTMGHHWAPPGTGTSTRQHWALRGTKQQWTPQFGNHCLIGNSMLYPLFFLTNSAGCMFLLPVGVWPNENSNLHSRRSAVNPCQYKEGTSAYIFSWMSWHGSKWLVQGHIYVRLKLGPLIEKHWPVGSWGDHGSKRKQIVAKKHRWTLCPKERSRK